MAAINNDLLIFLLQNQRFALQLSDIERVILSVAIFDLNDTPGFIEGVIDYHGEIIAVINLRKRFGYHWQEIRLSDRFIIVKTPHRKLALIVDQVEDVISPDTVNIVDSKVIGNGLKFLNFVRDEGGIIFICDVENVLEISEEMDLQQYIIGISLAGSDL